MAKPAAPVRRTKPAAPARNPIKMDDRTELKPQGRPRESAESRRHYHFQIEESVADRFDALAEEFRKSTGGRTHGAAKKFLVHMIEQYQ